MQARFPASLAFSTLTHAAACLVAAFFIGPVTKLDLLRIEPMSFTLEPVSSEPVAPSSTTSPPALVRFPAVPRPTTLPASQAAETPPPPLQRRAQEPTARPEKISYRDFQRQHGTASVSAQAPARSPVRIAAPPLGNLTASGPSSPSPSSGSAGSNTFTAELVQKLRAAYEPIGREELGLSCQIQFLLNAAGHVSSAGIVTSSGNPAFDAAVLSALDRVRVSRPPEEFVGTMITTVFRVSQ